MERTHKEPGIYPGLSFGEYAAIDAVNASLLKELSISPAHAFDYMHRPEEPKRHFAVGQASHTWLLEPHHFADHVCVAGQCAATTGRGERCRSTGSNRYGGEWYCNVRGHLPGPADEVTQAVVTADEFEQMTLAAESLCSHSAAMQLLTSDGENELTIVAKHERTGLLLKSRLDISRPQFRTICDLKTCRSAQHRIFAADMAKNGYDIQAAFYVNVARMAGMDAEHFAFLALEKTRPYLPSVVRVVDNLIDTAWQACERLLDQYVECQTSGVWPGYGDGVVDIDVPQWRYDMLLSEGN